MLQGRLTLVRYNNEPQFFVADAACSCGLVADIIERLGPYLEPDSVDAETLTRLREAVQLIERKTASPRLTRRAGRTPPLPARALRCASSTSPRPARTAARRPSRLGLSTAFRRRGLSTGFIKPVGQRTVIEDGVPADEDAVLMKTIFDLPEPFAGDEPGPHPARLHEGVHRGRGRRGPRRADPCAAHAARSRDHDVLLIEGTGHAGVGAVVGLSNAVVARMLGAPAVIVSEGGVGRPIDEIVLNAALFARHGVAGRGRHRQQGGRRRAARRCADTLRARPGAATGSRCSASCRTGRSCRTRRWHGPRGRAAGECSTRARTSTGSSAASRSARWSRTTCSSGSARARSSSSPATART